MTKVIFRVALGAVTLGIVAMLVWMYSAGRQSDKPMQFDLEHTSLTLMSDAFVNGGSIPPKYTCDGVRALNPRILISGVPEGTVSLALIMDDHDVPKQLKPDGVFDHWVLYNVPPTTTEIEEGKAVGAAGANSSGQNAYTGPCPPREYEPREHRYVFTLYALDSMLTLSPGATKQQLLSAMKGHIIGITRLIGKYQRP